MIYGIIKVTLDDFSRTDAHWVPDVETICLFRSEAYRDRVLANMRCCCETYEDYVPFDREIAEHFKDEHGKFKKREI